MDKDYIYMNQAIEQARNGILPYGAVVVKDQQVLAQASSTDGDGLDPTSHAEILAIKEAAKTLGSSDLKGATLYSTSEPCLMCFGALWWSGIRNVVYGASITDGIEHDTCSFMKNFNVTCEQLNSMTSNDFEITAGVCRDEVLQVMDDWKGKTAIKLKK